MNMIPVFLINLDRDTQRLAAMEREFSHFSRSFERISAVQGLALPEPLRAFFLDEAGHVPSILTNGEVGCYASHLLAMQIVLERGLPYALVVEDDIAFEEGGFGAIEEALAAAPAGWDFIRLSNPANAAYCAVSAFKAHDLAIYSRIPDNTGAYLVSAAGAHKFLKAGLRSRPIDEDFRYAYDWNLQVYGVLPAPVRANIFPASSIEDMGTRKRKKLSIPDFIALRMGKMMHIIRRDHAFVRRLGLLKMLECRVRTRLYKVGFARTILRAEVIPRISG